MSTNVDKVEPMLIRTPRDLGAAIRSRRKALGLDQAALAARVGVSRQWIIDIEKGKPRAALDLVLQTLQALGISPSIDGACRSSGGPQMNIPFVDLGAVIARTQKKKP